MPGPPDTMRRLKIQTSIAMSHIASAVSGHLYQRGLKQHGGYEKPSTMITAAELDSCRAPRSV